jgi:two-component system chemotaxis response regulator CheB
LSLEQIPAELVRLTAEELWDAPEPHAADSLEEKETHFLELEMPQLDNAERPGRPSSFACPDCGGVLWELEENGFLRFRCRVGHAFTARHLSVEQRHAIETALWSALRALEESAALYRRLADRATSNQQRQSAERFQERADNTETNARTLRQFLVDVNEVAAD